MKVKIRYHTPPAYILQLFCSLSFTPSPLGFTYNAQRSVGWLLWRMKDALAIRLVRTIPKGRGDKQIKLKSELTRLIADQPFLILECPPIHRNMNMCIQTWRGLVVNGEVVQVKKRTRNLLSDDRITELRNRINRSRKIRSAKSNRRIVERSRSSRRSTDTRLLGQQLSSVEIAQYGCVRRLEGYADGRVSPSHIYVEARQGFLPTGV